MSNILEQMLEENKRQLELEFEHKKELAQIKSCQNNEIKELKAKHKKQVADLEAKLAESESEVKVGEFWHSAYQGKQKEYDMVYAELRKSYDENEKLKQQLAEKEKEIESKSNAIKRLIVTCCGDCDEKINLAIEQLEKVKELLFGKAIEITGTSVDAVRLYTINEIINQQIEQLKKEME